MKELEVLQAALVSDGFDLYIVSGFRSFDRQLTIWNEKFTGIRPVLDDDNNIIDLSKLTDVEKIFKILRWSALPGLSRHHWGTDFDVADGVKIQAGYKVQLIPSEYQAGGVFYDFSLWLDKNLEKFGFFRPYQIDQGKTHPEPWHISHRELSRKHELSFSKSDFIKTISAAPIAGKTTILNQMDQILDWHGFC